MTKVVFLLACRWDNISDKPKLKELENLNCKVYSVNDQPSDHPLHVQSNFKQIRRGLDTLEPLIRDEINKGNSVDIILDHGWLQTGYYRERYGMNWLSEKVKWLLALGVYRIFLPRDLGEDMQQMLDDAKIPNTITLKQNIPDEENPYFVSCNNLIAKLTGKEKASAIKHINGYTRPNHRFVLIQSSR